MELSQLVYMVTTALSTELRYEQERFVDIPSAVRHKKVVALMHAWSYWHHLEKGGKESLAKDLEEKHQLSRWSEVVHGLSQRHHQDK